MPSSWSWRNDHGQYVPMDKTFAKDIEKHFLSGATSATVPFGGSDYTIKFFHSGDATQQNGEEIQSFQMTQTNRDSGKCYDIQRDKGLLFFYDDHGSAQAFDQKLSARLEAAIRNHHNTTTAGMAHAGAGGSGRGGGGGGAAAGIGPVFIFNMFSTRYAIDVSTLTQTNTESGRVRKLSFRGGESALPPYVGPLTTTSTAPNDSNDGTQPPATKKAHIEGRGHHRGPNTANTKDAFSEKINVTTAALTRPVRVAEMTVWGTTFDTTTGGIVAAVPVEVVLWATMDLCVAAEQRACVLYDRVDLPVALTTISVDLFYYLNQDYQKSKRGKMSIIGPLITRYPAVARSLQKLAIGGNDYDESADLAAFGMMATHLRYLNIYYSALASVRGLEGNCEHLQSIRLHGCNRLQNLEGLGNHKYLEEVCASETPIRSLEPLLSCPALKTLQINHCEQLSSFEGLQGHLFLKDIDAGGTPIVSVAPLLTCPALTSLRIASGEQLSSLEGLQGHLFLKDIDAGGTPITSLVPLSSCPVITSLCVYNCKQLSSLEGLQGHHYLKDISAGYTRIASVAPLLTCPALTEASFYGCKRLPTNLNLPPSVNVLR